MQSSPIFKDLKRVRDGDMNSQLLVDSLDERLQTRSVRGWNRLVLEDQVRSLFVFEMVNGSLDQSLLEPWMKPWILSGCGVLVHERKKLEERSVMVEKKGREFWGLKVSRLTLGFVNFVVYLGNKRWYDMCMGKSSSHGVKVWEAGSRKEERRRRMGAYSLCVTIWRKEEEVR